MSKDLLNNNNRVIQRSMLRGSLLSDSDIEKPLIGILVSYNTLTPLDNTDSVIGNLKTGIYESGATPIVLRVASTQTGMAIDNATRLDMPYRELVADFAENIILTQNLDGVIMVYSDQMSLAGLALASVRTNIPTIFCSSGHVASSTTLPQMILQAALNKTGKLSIDILRDIEHLATSGDNSMTGCGLGLILEAMGLMLPHASTLMQNTPELLTMARRTGVTAAMLVSSDIRPTMILSKTNIENAVRFMSCTGISSDCVLHILALAIECGIKLDLSMIQNISDKTPTLISTRQSKITTVHEFASSGGVMAVLAELAKKGLLDSTIIGVGGRPLSALYKDAILESDGIIHSIDNPLSPMGAIGVLRGELAEDGAIYNRPNLGIKPAPFVGKAKVFDDIDSALSAIALSKISSGDCIIIRFEGAKGSPGMPSIAPVQAMLMSNELSTSVAIITDARASNNYDGTVICNISPEAIEGGKLAIVKTGDKVTIDYIKGKIEFDVPAKEISLRLKKFDNKDITATGLLQKYCALVKPANKGATTKLK